MTRIPLLHGINQAKAILIAKNSNKTINDLVEQISALDKLFNEEAHKNEALHRENMEMREMLEIKEGQKGEEEISFLTWVMKKMKQE